MSDIDFQNGLVVGMAIKGSVKSFEIMDGTTLKGHEISNGSRGVWPLVLTSGAWQSKPLPASSKYKVLNSPPLNIFYLSLRKSKFNYSFKTDATLYMQNKTCPLIASSINKIYVLDVFDTPPPDVYSLNNAGDLICTLSGREYRKTNNGWCIAAYYYEQNGYWGPILVSEDASAVSYTTCGNTFNTKGTVQFNSKTYYYSNTEYFMGGSAEDTSGTGRVKLSNGAKLSAANAALTLLDLYF